MIPEVSRSTARCPYPERWTCYDDQATELEVLNMLTALVTMLKPEVIVETGCYRGYGTERLVMGAAQNGFGAVYTCDVSHEMIVATQQKLSCRDTRWYTVDSCTGVELISKVPSLIDFAFIDSSGDASVRAEELRLVIPKLSPWGVVVVHDTGETHPDHRDAIEAVVKELDLAAVFFDTPRGCAIIRRKV